MGLTSAMHNAMSGLTAAARQAQVAASNIANAGTEDYAPRQVALSAATLGGTGGGVRITGVLRQGDPVIAAALRESTAAAAAAATTSGFWTGIERAIGLPDTPGSLNTGIARLEAALVSAATRPDLDDRLAAVGDSARALAGLFNRMERDIQQQRLDADGAIARDVTTLSDGLQRIAELNTTIRKMDLSGQSPLGLMDERDRLLNILSEIVPMHVMTRPDGQVRLYSQGGQLLLDGTAQTLHFAAATAMDAGMSVQNGQLSGLQVAGRVVDTGPEGPLAGGRLAALFALRDQSAPMSQDRIDTLAADLIARFQDPATDPSLAAGSASLFTDAGQPLAAPALPGLAGRLAVSAAIDPSTGGTPTRLRDGLGTAPMGPVGDPTQINRWLSALERPLSPAPGMAATDFAGAAGGLLAQIGQARNLAEDRSAYAGTRLDAIRDTARERGVDTDAELQRLLLVEQAHAANARVIQITDDMLRRLMEI